MSVIVQDRVSMIIRAEQTPGLIIYSKHTVCSDSSPADSSVSHCYINPSAPLDLPVTATSQTSSTRQLRPGVKSVWMIRIWLLLFHICHLLVVVGQFEVFVHCVCVDCVNIEDGTYVEPQSNRETVCELSYQRVSSLHSGSLSPAESSFTPEFPG